MVSITRDELIDAFEKGQPLIREKFMREWEQQHFGNVRFAIQYDPASEGINLTNSPEFLAWCKEFVGKIINMTVLYVVEAVTAVGDDQQDLRSEVTELKARLERIEMEMLKLLPPEFGGPSSRSPGNN